MFGAPDCALDDEMVTMRPQPGGEHVGDRGLHAVERAGEVDREDPVPLLGGDVGERVERLDARAGDEDLDRTELGADARERGVDRRAVGDVDLDADRALAAGGGTSAAAALPFRSSSATRWPSAASWRATPSPMPEAPPVTTATRLMRRSASTGVNSRCSSVRPRSTHVGS